MYFWCMKKMSPFKYIYYSGLSVFLIVMLFVLSGITSILFRNFDGFSCNRQKVYVIKDTVHQNVVVYDTVTQNIVKTNKISSEKEKPVITESITETTPVVLDTTK